MKIRNEIEELFFKPNNIFKDDMDKLKKKKKRNDRQETVSKKCLVWVIWMVN